ncbi:MAG: PepSY domain-containing protein, partial [Dysosmobacter sp.]|nr:PepSY domain-containing protein [Dysosmobacter sp.]
SGQEWGGGTSGGAQGSAGLISEDDAKAAALSHAGVSAQDADYIRWELDRDDGVQLYEIEFTVGRVEYEYEIDAVTGAVLKAEMDR